MIKISDFGIFGHPSVQARRLHHKDHRDLIVVRPSRLHIIDDPRPEATPGGDKPRPYVSQPDWRNHTHQDATGVDAGHSTVGEGFIPARR